MMIENTRVMRKKSLNAPYFIPIEVASDTTKVECAEGIPPLPNILFIVNLPLSACIHHFMIIAKRSAKKGTARVYSLKYKWRIEIFIYYFTSIILYSLTPPGDVTFAVSPVFFPMSDRPIGDSFDILFSKIFAS